MVSYPDDIPMPPKRTDRGNAEGFLSAFAKRAVMLGINAATDPADMKERVMIAYQDGHLTHFEVDALISLKGLESA